MFAPTAQLNVDLVMLNPTDTDTFGIYFKARMWIPHGHTFESNLIFSILLRIISYVFL